MFSKKNDEGGLFPLKDYPTLTLGLSWDTQVWCQS